MNHSEASAIYDKMSPSDKRYMGIIGVCFAYEFVGVIWHRFYSLMMNKEDPANEG